MADETMHDRNFFSVILDVPSHIDVNDFIEVVRIKNTIVVKPGLLISSNGETDGIFDLAQIADGRKVMLVVEETPMPEGYTIEDTTIGSDTLYKFVRAMRRTGGHVTVAMIRADSAAATERLQEMVLAANGTIANFAGYTDTVEATDIMLDYVGQAAEAVALAAGDNKIVKVYW